MTELKPCPFCGGEGRIVIRKMNGIYVAYAECRSCGAIVGMCKVVTRFSEKTTMVSRIKDWFTSPRCTVDKKYARAYATQKWNKRYDERN